MSLTAAPRVGYGVALRSREFRALFAAQAVTIAGSSIAAVALTVLVYDRTGSAFLSSLTFALGSCPTCSRAGSSRVSSTACAHVAS